MLDIWVTVFESVLGVRLRHLAKKIGCSQNEALGILVRMWMWGIHNADENGRNLSEDEEDLVECLTIGLVPGIEPNKVIDSLIDEEWIGKDEEGLYIVDWHMQGQWYKTQLKREKDKERKRRERARKAAKKDEPSQSITGTETDAPRACTKKRKTDYPTQFERFWAIYPRRIGKAEAYRKYKARVNDGWDEETLYLAAQNYAKSCEIHKTDSQYIKHAKTFLSDTTPFIDYIPNMTEQKPKEGEHDEDNPYADWG